VSPAMQLAARFGLLYAAPQLEEEGHPGLGAAALDTLHPCLRHWPRAVPAFSADNCPVDARQIEIAKSFEQRLDPKEAQGGGRRPQIAHARQAVLLVFDAHAPPDVRAEGSERQP